MKTFITTYCTLLNFFVVSGQCKFVTAYKYLNIDEVTIFTDNIRCSEGLKATSHVSHKFGNNDGTYFIETSVVLHSIKDADKFNNVQYNFILGDGNRISKSVTDYHIEQEVPSTSLGDAIGAIDALATICHDLLSLKSQDNCFVLVTHYNRILQYVRPDFLHIMHAGQVVLSSSDADIAQKIEEQGFDQFIKEVQA